MDRLQFLKRSAAGALGLALLSGSDVPKEVFNPPDPPKPAAVLGSFENLSLLSAERVIDIGFKNALKGQQHAYPLLYKAVQNMQPAFSVKHEWLRHHGEWTRDGHKRLHAYANYTQIFRSPFGITNTEMSSMLYSKDSREKRLIKLRNENLHRHLGAIEQALRFGKASNTYPEAWQEGALMLPVRTMGGIREFPPGTPKLVVLRDLQLLTNRQMNDSDMYQEEFLSEVTLQVS